MIKFIVYEAGSLLNVSKVHDPAAGLLDWAGNIHTDTEGMAMKSRALVLRGNVGQAVRRLDGKFLEDLHVGYLTRPAGVPAASKTLCSP